MAGACTLLTFHSEATRPATVMKILGGRRRKRVINKNNIMPFAGGLVINNTAMKKLVLLSPTCFWGRILGDIISRYLVGETLGEIVE